MTHNTDLQVRMARRRAYLNFDDTRFREVVYSLLKSMQAQGLKIPQTAQDYVDHCDKVKRDIPNPKKE
ncbi:hypothetical protein [Thalassospira povalilytica]|uniref:hypothetical protein n=1 Tax=Thalassospira povalilytica TaxID=732237 RepID=UPI003AA9D1AC